MGPKTEKDLFPKVSREKRGTVSNEVSRERSVNKESIKLIRKRLRGNILGKQSISKFAHHLATEAEEFPRTTTVYNLMAKIIFLSLTDHVRHQIALLDINLPVYSQTRLTPFSFG